MKRLQNVTIYILALICLTVVLNCETFAREPFFKEVDLFSADNKNYGNFRIPAVVVTPNGTVLAFCEGREKDSDTGDIDIVLKRSFDNGNTWEPLQVVRNDGANCCGNPCPVVDRDTGTVWLVHSHNLGYVHESEIIKGTGDGTRTVWALKSTDDGATWSEPEEITAATKAPNWTWIATGPGIGIQLESGRLVIPCDHAEANTFYLKAHVIYSDDHGETWHLGGTVNTNFIGEPQVVELSDGRLLLNARNCDARLFFVMPFPTVTHTGPYRTIAVSGDGGLTWSESWVDSVLIETGGHG
ncbi:unnamed protein product, partial [marine sediment metagenome]